MRVLCENCGTTYKIPDSKLVREVNRATCRKCGHMMVIRVTPTTPSARPGAQQNPGESEEERTLVTSLADVERRAKEQAAAMEAQTARVQPVEGPEVTDTQERTDAPPTGSTLTPDDDLSGALDSDVEGDLPTAEEPTQAPEEFIPPPPPVPAPPPAVANLAGRAAPPPAPAPAPAPARARPAAPVAEPGTTTQPTLYGVPTPVAPEPAQHAESTARQRGRSHDPSGDLTLVLMGSLLAMGGALILAFNGSGDAGIRFLGLLVALFGAFASFLVVATSNRGRKPASVVVSLFLSVFGSVLFAGVAFVMVASGDGPSLFTTMTQGMKAPVLASAPKAEPAAEPAKPAAEPAETPAAPAAETAPAETPPAAVDPAVEALLAGATTASAPATTAPATTAPTTTATAPATTAPATTASAPATTTASAPATTSSARSSAPSTTAAPSTSSSASKPSTTSSSTASSARSSSSTSTASTASASKPSTTSSSTSSSSRSTSSATPSTTTSASTSTSTTEPKAGLQRSVVDTMIRTNSGVKRCFAEEKSRSGELPSQVDVKITIVPTGNVTTAAVKGGDYAGSALDSCLSSAIKGIQFPPFDGNAVSLTYPFRL